MWGEMSAASIIEVDPDDASPSDKVTARPFGVTGEIEAGSSGVAEWPGLIVLEPGGAEESSGARR